MTVSIGFSPLTEHRISWTIDSASDADYIYPGTPYVLPLGGSGGHSIAITVYDIDGIGTNCPYPGSSSITCN